MSSNLINPCDITVTRGQNTGIECDTELELPRGPIVVPANYSWSESDMADPYAFIQAHIHAAGSSRFYPVLQGIFGLELAKDSDVTEQNAITRVTSVLIPGGYTLTYTFEKGGNCLAKAILSFQGKGYRVILVDQNNNFKVHKNADGTLQGLQVSDITGSIQAASPTAKYKNVMVLGISQDEYIKNSKIYKSDTTLDFNGLIDTEITKYATPGGATGYTAATRISTITAIGTTGATIEYKDAAGNTLTGGPVIQTSAETTPTLLAAKIRDAFNANTSTNGGYSATASAGAITESGPSGLGASLNTSNIAPIITAGITETHTAFSGGVTGTVKLKIGVRTQCAHTDLVNTYGAALAKPVLFVVTDNADATATPITVTAALVTDHLELTGPFISGHTYHVVGTLPSVWLANSIVGYDAEYTGLDILNP